MIESLKPYPGYKYSGSPWLGSVPQHWSVLPNRAIFAEVKDRNHPDEEMLSVTITRGVIQQKALLADSSKKDSSNLNKSAYKLVCQGDIAYNKMRAWQGAIGTSNLRGIISPAYVVMRLRHDHNPSYFHELYRTPHFAKEAERWSYGITSDMWSLRPEHFKMIYSVIPPRDEQNAIVRLVDYANRRIERYIRAKKKLITLLNEQKEAIIHRAVTHGLDPNVRLKPSGIAWIGDIPEHWKSLRAKQISQVFIPQRDKPELNEREGFPWITPVNVGEVFVNSVNLFVTQSALVSVGSRVLPGGSVIASCVGRFGIASVTEVPVIINQQLQAYVPSPLITAKYLRHCVQVARPYFEAKGNSTTLAYVDRQGFGSMPLPLPPRDEQEAIERFLEAESIEIDQTIVHAQREIALILEYRTRLVADVVTGQLDVRAAAAKLPEEPEELEPLDDAEALVESEEALNESDLEAETVGEDV